MKISMIAAMAKNRVIGKDNQMPWHLPADLKHFKSVTLGKPVIMGRKTYESIGKALPGRKNIVISSNEAYLLNDAVVTHSCESALRVASLEALEVMIIGGGAIYEAFLPQANQLFLTFIDLAIDGDTHFPNYAEHARWIETERISNKIDDKNAYAYDFVTLVRDSN
jgi:dihydrofolate reductase